jgi:hypothetical protein
MQQYVIALILLGVGVVLWLLTWFLTRGDREARKDADLTHLDG